MGTGAHCGGYEDYLVFPDNINKAEIFEALCTGKDNTSLLLSEHLGKFGETTHNNNKNIANQYRSELSNFDMLINKLKG